ncbi:hypothetical protein GCM10028802_10630 [Terrabacter terrigena]
MPTVGAAGVYDTGAATVRRVSPARSGLGVAGVERPAWPAWPVVVLEPFAVPGALAAFVVPEAVAACGADAGAGPPQAAASRAPAATATAASARRVLTWSV